MFCVFCVFCGCELSISALIGFHVSLKSNPIQFKRGNQSFLRGRGELGHTTYVLEKRIPRRDLRAEESLESRERKPSQR